MDGRAVLQSFFLTGEKPTQDQFADLIESCFNLADDTITISMVSGLSAALAGKESAFSGSSTQYTKGNGTYATLGAGDITGALGFTPENVTNKSTGTGLGTSDMLYPSQNAVKTYVDSAVAAVAAGGGVTAWTSITGAPSTLAGYGITDALTAAVAAASYQPIGSYLTGVTSAEVIGALGYTPYNAGNPAGYISGIAWGAITGTLSSQADLQAALNQKTPNLTPYNLTAYSYTAASGQLITTNPSSASQTVTLPGAPANYTVIGVKMVSVTSPYTTVINTGGSDVFNVSGGATSRTLNGLNEGVILVYYAGIWYVTAYDIGSPFPSQTGYNGYFLTTNGTTMSWASVGAFANPFTSSFTISSTTTPQFTIQNGNSSVQFTVANSGFVITPTGTVNNIVMNSEIFQATGTILYNGIWGGNAVTSNFAVAGLTNGSTSTLSQMLFGGGTTIGWKISLGSNGYNTAGANPGATVIIPESEFLINEAGVHPLWAQLVINPGYVDNYYGSGGTTTNMASLYINGQSTSSITGISAGLWVHNAYSKFEGLVNLMGYTVATLPATARAGDVAYVTDASSPAALATVTGAGATVVKVFYNGTNWIVQ